jgi:medium-chain acyl-[acyl-carrier-protein] hydrolase
VTSPWFLSQRALSKTATVRLFCFPFAGVGPSVYRGWADVAGRDVDVRVVQLPGREGRLREPALTSVDAIVSEVAAAIAPLLDLPYAFFGHSLGGLIAFELARTLRERRAPALARLFVSASRPPHVPNPFAPLRQLDDLGLLTEIDRRYGGSVPAAVMESADLREFLVPPLRADITALETYTYRPAAPLACGISVFAGSEDPTIARGALDAWQEQTTASCRIRTMEGGHLFLQPLRTALVRAVRDDLSYRAGDPLADVRPPQFSMEGL